MPNPRSLASAATTVAVLAALGAAAPAGAAAPTTTTLARHLLSPLTLAVDGNEVYVTQNFGGVLSKLRAGKPPKALYHSKNEVGGVSAHAGRIVFTETASDDQGPTDSWLKLLRPSGKAKTLAHIRAYENAHNPDGSDHVRRPWNPRRLRGSVADRAVGPSGVHGPEGLPPLRHLPDQEEGVRG